MLATEKLVSGYDKVNILQNVTMNIEQGELFL